MATREIIYSVSEGFLVTAARSFFNQQHVHNIISWM